MELGARLSLDNDQWLQPIGEARQVPPDEYVVLLAEDYVAFADGEVARKMHEDDELETFDGMLLVPEDVMAARPMQPGPARTQWHSPSTAITSRSRRRRCGARPGCLTRCPAARKRTADRGWRGGDALGGTEG